MKKIIVCLLAICLVLTFAVACGDKKADSNTTNGTDASSSVISTVVSSSDASSTESTAESEPTMSEIMDWWGNVSIEVEAGN